VTQFVLVPGAWLGGWAWRAVATRLREAGHEAFPATLTGLGDRAHLARPDVDLETHITDVENLIANEDLSDVVLVGHSYAGIVVEGVADRVPDRVATVVYLDTGPLPDGWSTLDFSPPDERARLERTVQEAGDGWRLPFPGVDHLGAPSAVADFDDATRDLMTRKAVAQPFGTYRQSIRLTHPFAGEYERVAIVAGGFGMPAAQLRSIIASGAPPFGAMTGPDWRFLELETGHWPMLTAPDRLAAMLQDAAAHPTRDAAPAGGRR
jgi:pimeloyl-ACP methyl ester carboxylesterase